MMKRSMHQITTPISDNEIISGRKEKGTLSIITEKKFIRRIYLNDKVVPMEVDLCSLVSVVTSDNLESSRKLEIIKRIGTRPLGHEHPIDLSCEIESVAKKTTPLHDEQIKTKRSLDPYITITSDDPRRGGKRGHLDTVDSPPDTSTVRYTGEEKSGAPDEDDTVGLPVHLPKESDIIMTSHVKSMVQEEKKETPILSPRLSTTTQRAKIITKERNVKIRIPWWNELISMEENDPNADDENGKKT